VNLNFPCITSGLLPVQEPSILVNMIWLMNIVTRLSFGNLLNQYGYIIRVPPVFGFSLPMSMKITKTCRISGTIKSMDMVI
jgi:hypothetical protein